MSSMIRPAKLIIALLSIGLVALPAAARATPSPAPQIAGAVLRRFPADWGITERRNYLLPYIFQAAQTHGVDPQLILTVCELETTFQPNLTSPMGAMGLMQLMPGTAARFGVTDPYDFRQSLEGGAQYLRVLGRLFNGNLDLVLAGYNSGEGNVIKYGRRVPPFNETQGYVARGRVIYLRYLQTRFPNLNLVQLTGSVRAPSTGQTLPAPATPASLAVEDAPQDEPAPPTRSLVYGEGVKPSVEQKENNQAAPVPARVTRSIKFQ